MSFPVLRLKRRSEGPDDPEMQITSLESPTRQQSAESDTQADAAAHFDGDAGMVAAFIDRYGMSAPAAIGLQIARPLAWVAGQMLWVLEPFVGGARVGTSRKSLSIADVAALLEKDGGLDSLLARLSKSRGFPAPRGSRARKEHEARS